MSNRHPKKAEMIPEPSSVDQPADWVKSMHAYYQVSGSYRMEDLMRVLGDPRDAVELGPSAELHFACRIAPK